MRTAILILVAFLLIGCSTARQETPPAGTTPAQVLPTNDQVQATATPVSEVPATETETAAPEATATLEPTVTPVQPTQPEPTSTTQPAEPVGDFPNPDEYSWQPLISGLDRPVGITNAGDGSGRLFVIERPGRIRILQEGNLEPEAFLDISGQVGSSASEQGLLGLAFHPNYEENGFFYVNYTDLSGDTVIARFQRAESDGQRAEAGSELRLLGVDQPYANHNGGGMEFGPDGYLYLGLGDGGAGGDPQGNGQSVDTLLGKILRIDVNGDEGGRGYAIPADNPFVGGGGRPEIWAYGLRNPWRFSFDRQTGDLYIGDVGQNQWEEIDFLPSGSPGGANFGWNIFEGNHPYQSGSSGGTGDFIEPAADYNHGLGCSVTGGVVYRGSQIAEWQGVYLFGDFCSGNIWGLRRTADGTWKQALLFEAVGGISSFGESEAGEVYLADYSGNIRILSRLQE